MNSFFIKISRYGIIYIILTGIFVGLLFASAALPHIRKFKKLMERSSNILVRQGPYPYAYYGGCKMDNHTDSLILNVAFSFDPNEPVQSSLRSLCYHEGETNPDSTVCLKHLIEGKQAEMQPYLYWRYWFGQSAVMKILHYVWHLGKIYPLYGAITMLLAVIGCSYALRSGKTAFSSLFFLLALCNFQVFFQSLQYPPVFWIGLAGLIWMGRQKETSGRGPAFFTLGMLTAYFDLLTAPILSFGIPALIICGKDTLASGNEKSGWKSYLCIWFGYPAAWLAGYIMSWGTKILLSIPVCGSVRQALHQILLRSGSTYRGLGISRWKAVEQNFEFLYDHSQLLLYSAVIFAVVLLVLALIHLKKGHVEFHFPLFTGYIFLAALPLAVILLMANHTYLHAYMTYRGLALTVAALLMSLTAFQPKKGAES